MDFIGNIKELAEKALSQKDLLDTEEATKNALIMPFIQELGYNVFDPQEVRPEYTADIGTKKGEKVDYAIFRDDSPAILLECKALGVALDSSHRNQLFRYFSAIAKVRFGVLTNGLMYQFYTDLDHKNRMDEKPFLEFNLSNIQEPLVEELQKFTKANFNADTIISRAEDLKYTREIKHLLAEEYNAPTKEFVRFCMDRVEGGSKTKKRVEQFTGFAKRAFREFVYEHSAPADTAESNNELVASDSSTPPVSDKWEWQPLSEFSPQPSDPKPTKILFPDNSQVPLKTSKAILVEVVRWLINKNKLNVSHCPFKVGDSKRTKRYLISTDPKHSDGEPFTAPEKIEFLYTETHANSSMIIKYARRIIEHVGQDQNPAQFKVR
ncbi:MAG: restriction endonuclease [Gemmatimonadetes bacterium]|nr:restriction endonuclease [Gemmatimonadota bacterium]